MSNEPAPKTPLREYRCVECETLLAFIREANEDEDDQFMLDTLDAVEIRKPEAGFPLRFRCRQCGGFSELDVDKDFEEARMERDVRFAKEMGKVAEKLTEFAVSEGEAPYESLEKIREANQQLEDLTRPEDKPEE